MEREVIAARNGKAVVMNIVISAVALAALGYLVYLACTGEDTGSIVVGALLSALALAVVLWYGVPAVLILCKPKDIIVKSGTEFVINGKKYALSDISTAQLKMHRVNSGEFAFGDIVIELKKGGKVICRGIENAKDCYERFCAVFTGGKLKQKSTGDKRGK